MLQVLDLVEKRYAPEVQAKTNAEGPTTITNTAKPDSAVKPDTGNKPK